MDRHVASLLAMTNKKGFIAFPTRRLGVDPNSPNLCGPLRTPRLCVEVPIWTPFEPRVRRLAYPTPYPP
jgi:hypothetical protein